MPFSVKKVGSTSACGQGTQHKNKYIKVSNSGQCNFPACWILIGQFQFRVLQPYARNFLYLVIVIICRGNWKLLSENRQHLKLHSKDDLLRAIRAISVNPVFIWKKTTTILSTRRTTRRSFFNYSLTVIGRDRSTTELS